ncbi:MAG: helicase-related protein [Nannocystaceae bacterium]
MGAGDKHASRHAGYYREAADILGLVEVRRWVLTARGRGLLSTEAGSEEERAVLRDAVADAEELGKLGHAVLAQDEPDVEALIEWALEALERGARSTVERRVKDTLSWRQYLGVAPAPRPRRHFLLPERSTAQLDLLTRAPTIEPGEWPKAELLPFNWPQDQISVQRITQPDLQASEEVLLVMGYASLQHLCEFVSSLEEDLPKTVRVVFGHEPFVGGDRPPRDERGTLSQDMRDFWLEQGISIIHAKAVLETIEALETERLRSRISRRSQGLHAKMFIGQDAITVGSSNFTEPGLERQLEANVRLRDDRKTGAHLREARKLGEIYWKLSVPFDEELRALLEQLLRRVTWPEALARACAELLEGQWARGYLTDELGYGGRLWPSQVQGIGQALYVLMEVGSVLVADATGSGKTRTGAWLLRALRQRLVSMGRPISDPVLVSPPAVSEAWADELHDAELRVETHSHGALSSGRAASHERVKRDVASSRLLALDEAHNFINASNRTALVTTNLADHVVLFTATPINRDVSDLLGIADLLGADNLDDETLRVLEDAGWRRRRDLTEEDKLQLRRAVRRFTVRRTKDHFNALIDREPARYRNRQGTPCRYPQHESRYYSLKESKKDRRIGAEITRLARSLRGVLLLRNPLKMTKAMRDLGWTPEKYVSMRLQSARALSRYQVRVALRSSRAALWEHLHGTASAKTKFGLRRLDKSDSGEALVRLEQVRDSGPPRATVELRPFLPDWLVDDDEFDRACKEDLEFYERIALLCDELSDGRERAKVRHLRSLLERHGLVVAFDSRPITLALVRKLVEQPKLEVFVASGGRKTDQRAVQEAFKLGAKTRAALALCSNSMSEGVNLQQASAVVHLDMPSVVRIAEQRVGRIDRMDSPHDRVESWWPKDAPEFALSSDEKLDERLDLVGDILGANVNLPFEDDEPRVVRAEDFVKEMEQDERAQIELLDDAFSPVRDLVEGKHALVEAGTYALLRKSEAKVLSAVAVVRSPSPWGFFTLPGTGRSAPRWMFYDPSKGELKTALEDVALALRSRLVDVEDVDLDGHAVGVMETLLGEIEQRSRSLLPRRKQRALEQMKTVLERYSKAARREQDDERGIVVDRLLGFVEGDGRIDLDELAERWLAAIRPRWREAIESGGRRSRRGGLKRLQGLVRTLVREPLSTDVLIGVRDGVRVAKPIAERVVAAIVGVPAQ